MVRPEKVRLTLAPGGGDNSVQAVLKGVAFMGSITSYQLAVGDLTLTASLHDTAHLSGLAPGGTVYAAWQGEDALVLDAE